MQLKQERETYNIVTAASAFWAAPGAYLYNLSSDPYKVETIVETSIDVFSPGGGPLSTTSIVADAKKCAIVMLHLVVRMKMNNNLKKVSIKGRVAFSIHCFLNAVAKTDFVKSDDHLIDLIVNRAWYFVENDDLIMAYENFLDVVPGCILDHKVAGHVEFDSISYEDYLSLKRLYTIWPNHLNVILDSISYIMSFDLYSNTGEYSSDTLRFTNEIIEVALDNNLILPGVDRFLISSFNEKSGWGNKIKRNKF